VKIYYVTEGEGEPVVLIHGFTGSNNYWTANGLFKELAKEYRVIAIDCRGHGKSDKPHDPAKYGQEMAADVVRLLDHLKIKQAHVVGYSMGGFITMKLLSEYPDRVLSATVGGAGGSQPVDVGTREAIAKSLEEGKGLLPLYERLTPPGRPKPTPEQAQAIDRVLLATNDPKALAAVMRGMKALTVPEDKLAANKVPTQCIIGADDPLKTGVDYVKDRMGNLRIIVIPNADHANAASRPEFSQGVKEFLAKHRQKG
jgi:pimeloyl-ACP methyl ester carboxylesterase